MGEIVQSQHNKPNSVPKKSRRAKWKGIIMEKIDEGALKRKLEEEASDSPFPIRDVPQSFKDYVIDKVVIVIPQTLRPSPNEESNLDNGIYDGPARTKEINLAKEGEPENLVSIEEHLTEEESEKLRQLLKEY